MTAWAGTGGTVVPDTPNTLFIPVYTNVTRHRKLKKLARLLEVEVPTAVGMMVMLWTWAMEELPDGQIGKVDDDEIAEAMAWPGDPEVLMASLLSCKLVDAGGIGVVLHDWGDYGGKVEVNRAAKEALQLKRRELYNSEGLIPQVRARDGDTCQYCLRTVNWRDRKGQAGGTYDHVDPQGPTKPENVAVCCYGCYAIKGGRTPEEAGMRRPPFTLQKPVDIHGGPEPTPDTAKLQISTGIYSDLQVSTGTYRSSTGPVDISSSRVDESRVEQKREDPTSPRAHANGRHPDADAPPPARTEEEEAILAILSERQDWPVDRGDTTTVELRHILAKNPGIDYRRVAYGLRDATLHTQRPNLKTYRMFCEGEVKRLARDGPLKGPYRDPGAEEVPAGGYLREYKDDEP